MESNINPCGLFKFQPVHRLPPEMLIEIFTYCVEALGDDLMPLTLGNICGYWRNIVQTCPRLWRQLYLTDRRRKEALHIQSSLWLTRSGSLPLDIIVNLKSRDMLLPVLLPALSQFRRWRNVMLISGGYRKEYQLSGAGIRELNTLCIKVRDVSEQDDRDHNMFEPPPSPFLSDSLNDGLVYTALNLSVSALPSPSHMSTLHFAALTIVESSPGVVTDVVHMLNFLSFLPKLEIFRLRGVAHDGSSELNVTWPPVVSLKCLHTLKLVGTSALRPVLSHIDVPALIELAITHTNMDFAPQYDRYAAVTEDGDSDDEAHDFSQSPWSDHATGMGLRTLIRRSNPPLQRLVMDYADMRTKDFLWCFNHMETLKEFRIRASDMSNKVIDMLVPYRAKRVSLGAADSDAMQEDDDFWRVRLPQLLTLEFYHCQRLSGSAIVAALCKRVEFTDARRDEGINTLKDVGIIDCAGFLTPHVLDLSAVLGSRLRTVEVFARP
ncbi:hypothetical protein AcV5_007913 [Taiwanofungus camphoratus]|nr:hypothetical protein AcV5_007913 [Antrodia cinnamomea]